ncbi:NAD(P)H-dependent oxidoreductase [Thalassotalea euphylliae]|uniref:NAD(P)H-dependent oxidoreductase n=1 Tax=Thalassotalea euphylliae TaxID=1655234 RepID=UPI003636C49F
MSKVLVISGHPNLASSYTNSSILTALSAEVSDIEIRHLDQLYPDYQIDVAAEQAALLSADTIVFQFPFYWYSVPALLKKWLDDVFAYDFAYGSKGDKLKGKNLILSFTIGGPEESYDPLGYNHYPIEELIKPLKQTAYLAGLNMLPSIYTHRMVFIPGVYNTQEDVEKRALNHASRLIDTLNVLANSAETRIKKFVADWFAEFDQLPDSDSFFLAKLAEDINWVMPDGAFKGHAGFKDWYAIAKQTFQPGCDHQVEQIDVEKTNEGFEVNLRIRLIAQSLCGDDINMLVNETWQMTEQTDKGLIIHDYQVTAI